MEIKFVKTLINKNYCSHKKICGSDDTTAKSMYNDYLIKKYKEHENLVDNTLTDLAAKNNILWVGTRELIHDGYKDKNLIFTEIHYEPKI